MPITCHFKPDDRLVVSIHVGVVPDEEFLSSYKAFHEDLRFDKSFNQLIDLQHSESSGGSTEALCKTADFVQAQFVGVATQPRAAVIAPQDLSFGLPRMYEAYSQPVPLDLRVFRTLCRALAWLGASEKVMSDLEERCRITRFV